MMERSMNAIRTCLLFFVPACRRTLLAWAAPIFWRTTPRAWHSQSPATPWLQDDTGALTLDDVRGADQDRRFEPALPALQRSQGAQAHWFKLQWNNAPRRRLGLGHADHRPQGRSFGPFDSTGRALAPPVHTGLS